MTEEQVEIRMLKRSNQQLSQRIVQMTKACKALQEMLVAAGVSGRAVEVDFPVPSNPEMLPELHAYEQNRALTAAGLLRSGVTFD